MNLRKTKYNSKLKIDQSSNKHCPENVSFVLLSVSQTLIHRTLLDRSADWKIHWRGESVKLGNRAWRRGNWLNSQIPEYTCFYIPQCSIQNRDVNISVLNGALRDMAQMHSGICETGLLEDMIYIPKQAHTFLLCRVFCLFVLFLFLFFLVCFCFLSRTYFVAMLIHSNCVGKLPGRNSTSVVFPTHTIRVKRSQNSVVVDNIGAAKKIL